MVDCLFLHQDRFDRNLDIRELKFDDTVNYKSDNGQSVGELFLGFLSYYSNKFRWPASHLLCVYCVLENVTHLQQTLSYDNVSVFDF